MGKFGFLDRFRIPSYDDPEQIRFGLVRFDLEKCTGCSMCVDACPADALVLEDKKPAMRQVSENACAFCGDCAALCPADAITLARTYFFTGFYKTIDRGKESPPRL